ncbi:C-terminal binding protein [Nocardioides campestrisoli]|uniref:C-terminal binding protein n=1 Tax=Nocardioides campestrisoli TaxID=2736757 RepID=UPI001CD6EE43|nr:C-terminal binding protein [Nocardioides campestrisoli]
MVYTDPAWALDPALGGPDPARADLEREVLGTGVQIDLGMWHGDAFVTEGPEFLDWVDGADALVVYRAQVTEELCDALSGSCRVIARQGVGIDNLNVPLLRERDMTSFHLPDYCVDEVSTHSLALLLALERQVCDQDRLIKAGGWGIFSSAVPRRLADCTVGIVGFGRIGRATARRLQAFYGRIVAYDPYVPADLMSGYHVGAVDTLYDLFRSSDAVVLHAELTDETRSLVDDEALAAARPGTVLVNAARGPLVDSAAVERALVAGRLAGYASDVFTPEDPNVDEVNRRLVARPDVVVSSHRAFLSGASERSQRTRVAQEIARVFAGGLPRHGRLS